MHPSGAIKHLIMSMICSTGRACLGIVFVVRISLQWHEFKESTAAAEHMEHWCRHGMNTYVPVRTVVVVVVIPLYRRWGSSAGCPS